MNRQFLLPACAALTLLFTTAPALSRAQSPVGNTAASASKPNAFSELPADHWAYPALGALQDAGIGIGYVGTPGGRRVMGRYVPMTRYEFAVEISRITPILAYRAVPSLTKERWGAIHNDLQNRLQQSPLALDALMTLVIEFTPELKLVGQDVDLIQSNLHDVRQSVAKPIPGQPTHAGDEIPRDSWPYAAFAAITKDGVPFGYHMGDSALGGQAIRPINSVLTRYEFAVSVARILPLIESVGTPLSPERPFYLPAALQDATLPVIDSSRRDLESKMRRDTVLIDALRALLNEFRPELLQLHVDVSAPHRRLDNIEAKIAAVEEYSGPRRIKRRQNVPPRSVRATPFPDVPPNHWAFSAVETVRQAGIVVGYPKSAFRTDDGRR